MFRVTLKYKNPALTGNNGNFIATMRAQPKGTCHIISALGFPLYARDMYKTSWTCSTRVTYSDPNTGEFGYFVNSDLVFEEEKIDTYS